MTLEQLLALFGSLGGVAALVAVIIDLLKRIGVVNDGTAPTWATFLNLLGLVLLFVAKVFFPNLDIPGIDGIIGQVTQILTLIIALVFQFFVSRATHNVLALTPLGYSFKHKK